MRVVELAELVMHPRRSLIINDWLIQPHTLLRVHVQTRVNSHTHGPLQSGRTRSFPMSVHLFDCLLKDRPFLRSDRGFESRFQVPISRGCVDDDERRTIEIDRGSSTSIRLSSRHCRVSLTSGTVDEFGSQVITRYAHHFSLGS